MIGERVEIPDVCFDKFERTAEIRHLGAATGTRDEVGTNVSPDD